MADLGVMGEDGASWLIFFSKSKEILKFIADIQKKITNSADRETLEKTTEIITELVNQMMNSRSNKPEDLKS
jgi:hypothetical protein